MPSPFFSIIMPVYNGEKYIAHAIESVLIQNVSDWEFIVIDDCSTDKTPFILESYASKDLRIQVVRNEKNLKIARSLNRGIQKAQGTWMVRIDSDDFFNFNYLKTLQTHIESCPSNENYFFSCWASIVDESGSKILDVQLPDAETIRRMMKIENFLYHPATSFPKKLWEGVGGYPEEDLAIAEDTVLWTKFFDRNAKLVMIPECLLNYRIHYSNLTSINDAKLFKQGTAKEWKIIRQNREWRISLYLKQKNLKMARNEILSLGRMQKYLSLKNLQYFLLTFLPESFVYFYMWEIRPRLRIFLKNILGKSIRV